MTGIKSIHSELLKLKYPPILWLVGFVLFVTFAIVFSAYWIDIHKTITLGRNPWTQLNSAGEAIFSMFIGIPFIVLFISAAVHIEGQNNGFKQLYVLPIKRETLIVYKLSSYFICFFGTMILLILGHCSIGYILSMIFPESEFSYFDFPIFSTLKSYSYILISFLGVIGFQFFLSLQFKGFLVPASIGTLSYVIGLILSSTNNSISLYIPYCYPFIARDRGVMDSSALNIDQVAILNKVEISSIIIFVVFILISLYMNKRKNI